MSVSTNAILAFGFDLEETLPDAWSEQEDFDFEEMQAKEWGLEEPSVPCSSESDEWGEYWKKKRIAIEGHPASLIRHCSDNYTMYFLAVNGTEHLAYRGSPEPIDLSNLKVNPSKILNLKDFCKKHDIEWKEPKWYLFSYWG